jgi:hypothetical protein
MSSTLIDTYVIIYSANARPRRIELSAVTRHAGTLLFFPDNTRLPANRLAGKTPVLHYYLEDFANVLDILKHEKPVYLIYTGPGPQDENGLITKDPDETIQATKAQKAKRGK